MDADNKIEELKVLESNLQSLLTQRQSFQMEINEVDNALEELKDYQDEIYKLVSGMLIKTNKEKIVAELKEKKKMSESKRDAVEKQEKILEKRAETLKKEINALSFSKNKK